MVAVVDSVTARIGSPQDIATDNWRRGLLSSSVIIVTYCNRACPYCCAADVVRDGNPRNVPLDAIIRDITELGDAGWVQLNGGEATLHPCFPEVAQQARRIRGDGKLALYTNGARLLEHADVINECFDRVFMSSYDMASEAIAEGFLRVKSESLHFRKELTVHRRKAGAGQPCHRLFCTISVQEGKVYPCSVAHGFGGAPSTELSSGWERRLLQIQAGCDSCIFSQKVVGAEAGQ